MLANGILGNSRFPERLVKSHLFYLFLHFVSHCCQDAVKESLNEEAPLIDIFKVYMHTSGLHAVKMIIVSNVMLVVCPDNYLCY